MPTASRYPKFSTEEVTQYYERLHIAEKQRIFDINVISPERAFEHLAFLQRQHLAWVPFENLSLHYSRWRQISLHPEDLYKKIVQSAGRGGYCMENNALFAILLRTLGYRVRSCGARTHNGTSFGGWSHHINLVTIHNEVFVTDVGYGANNIITPLSLQKAGEVVNAIHQEAVRIVQTNLEEDEDEDNEDSDQIVWLLQHRLNPDSPWRSCYCFTELAFRPEDFEVMNFSTSQSPRRFFTQRVFCTKMIIDDSGKNIVGRLTLQTEIKQSINGKSEIIKEFANENDRLVALKEFFNIEFGRSDTNSIIGTLAQIIAP